MTDNVEKLIKHFHEAISECCDYECTSCGQIFFMQSVNRVPQLDISTELCAKCITSTLSTDGKKWICHTCLNHLRKKRLPPLAKANHMTFPQKPEVLKLNTLEERLVSPVNVFMQMRELPSGGQVCVKGNVV